MNKVDIKKDVNICKIKTEELKKLCLFSKANTVKKCENKRSLNDKINSRERVTMISTQLC